MATTAYGQPSLPQMHSLLSKLRPFLSLSSPSFTAPFRRRRSFSFSALPTTKAIDAALMKEKWLDSLSLTSQDEDTTPENAESSCIIGVDPDLSGALAVLKFDHLGSSSSAQVYDTPHIPVLVGKRVRKRLDAKSIVQLIQSLDVASGSRVYIEQSNPFPKDGKQGWYSGGFGYGLWIGTLVASGFCVIPVSASLWKRHFQLASGSCTKDDSRQVAAELFPSLSSQLKRKKDHGRAEALLIAAYGETLKTEKLLIQPTELVSQTINITQVKTPSQTEGFFGKRKYSVVSSNEAKKEMKMGLVQNKPKKKPMTQMWKQRSSGLKESSDEASSCDDKTRAGAETIRTAKDCTAKAFNIKLENRFLALDSESSS